LAKLGAGDEGGLEDSSVPETSSIAADSPKIAIAHHMFIDSISF
jgi:hypothetical protein